MTRPDKRCQIMKAAERLFTTRRFHEITTDEVAEAAAVGKGTIYRYFRDKEDLFVQTATSGFDELCDLVSRRVSQGQPFAAQLVAACEQITRFFEGRRQLFCMMQTEEGRMLLAKGSIHDRWVAHRRRLVVAVAGILRKGVREGKIRGDVPPEVLAAFLLGMLRTRVHDLGDAPAPVRRLERVVDLFCRGAATEAAAGAAAHARLPRRSRGGLDGGPKARRRAASVGRRSK